MGNSYSQIFIQCVFAVKYRAALLRKPWRYELFGVIGNLINEAGGDVHREWRRGPCALFVQVKTEFQEQYLFHAPL